MLSFSVCCFSIELFTAGFFIDYLKPDRLSDKTRIMQYHSFAYITSANCLLKYFCLSFFSLYFITVKLFFWSQWYVMNDHRIMFHLLLFLLWNLNNFDDELVLFFAFAKYFTVDFEPVLQILMLCMSFLNENNIPVWNRH